MGQVHQLDRRQRREASPESRPRPPAIRRVETLRLPSSTLLSSAAPRRLGWQAKLANEVMQNPLIETRTTLTSLGRATMSAHPEAVLVGVGLCDHRGASQGVPLDLLGLLLPAELVRRAVLAPRLVVLIADEHALRSGIPAHAVDRRVQEITGALAALQRALNLRQMRAVRASQIHRDFAYESLLETVRARAAASDNEYVLRQLADVEYFHRLFGGALKVGWTIGGSLDASRQRDEVAFDARFRQLMGEHVRFVYCKSGRTLVEGRPKASPYVVRDPTSRVMLRRDEQLEQKLALARTRASSGTINGVCRHVKLITRLYWELSGERRTGGAARRLGLLLEHLLAATPARHRPRPGLHAVS